MKRLITIIFVSGLLFATNLLAQSAAMVQWDCVLDQNVSTTVGNVVGQPQVGSPGFVVRSYTGSNSVGPLSTSHQRWWPSTDGSTGTQWGLETAQVDTRYVQMEVAPKAGNKFTVTNIEMYLAAGGTNTMRCNVWYSLNKDFSNPIKMNDTTIWLKQGSTKPEDTLITYKKSITVNDGSSLLVRVFPWYTGATSNSKYLYMQAIKIEGTTAIVSAVEENLEVPTEFALDQNFPNPFNPSTKIQISIPKEGNYSLNVYNLLGQEVATLVNENLGAGVYSFNFDARDLSSGVYLYKLTGNNVNITKKMLLMK